MAQKSRTPLAGEQLRLSNGDQVEIFRKQATKDRPGWIGPASVTDCTELSHGKVTVRWQGRHITVPLESVRRAMIYLVWLTEAVYSTMLDGLPTNALSYLLDFVESLHGRSVLLGWMRPDSTQGWRLSTDTAKHRDVYHALLHVATNHLHLDGCIAGRCVHGVQRLPKLSPGALGSVLMYWYIDNRDDLCYAQFAHDDAVDISKDLEQARTWHKLFAVQFHLYDAACVERVREEDHGTPQLGGLSRSHLTPSPSPIVRTPITVTDSPPHSVGQPPSTPDGNNGDYDDAQSDISDEVFWQDWLAECSSTDPSMAQSLASEESTAQSSASPHDWSGLLSLSSAPDPTYYLTPTTLGYEYLHAYTQQPSRTATTSPQANTHQRQLDRDLLSMQSKLHEDDHDLHDLIWQQPAELMMPMGMAYLSGLVPANSTWEDGDALVLTIDKLGVKRMVIETNKVQSNMAVSDAEIKANPEMVKSAVLAELKRWIENESFRRQPIARASNILTSRYVLTWKRQPDGIRIMKCRICVHGFKDVHRNQLERFSGTSTRWGQRAVVATAVQMRWPMASLDISQAFLKGLTFDEVQKIRGGPKRTVSMRLPFAKGGQPSGSALLRQFKGFESFNDALEVLEMLKGGFGLIDAPNLFTSRVDAVMRAVHLLPTHADPKFYVKHEKGQLVLVVSAHMDDFKATGCRDLLNWLHGILKKHFGDDVKMDLAKEFIHTGIRHRINDTCDLATLDQDEYAAALKPLSTAHTSKHNDTDKLDETLYACFLTLLGAAAWLLQTRMDIAVYVSALQRVSHKAEILHLKRLNRLIRYVQKNPQSLRYRPLKLPVCLVAVGDSAYQAPASGSEAVDPLVMRGFVLALAHLRDPAYRRTQESTAKSPASSGPGSEAKSPACFTYDLQVLEYACGKQNHVCRGVWSAELHNQCDMADMAVILLGFLEEVRHGPRTAESLRSLKDDGGYSTPLDMFTDSYSIFSYLRTQHLKFPAEKGTFFHLAYLRELLEKKVIRSLTWVDTRDMFADGMTKGALDRAALVEVMLGTWTLRHKAETHHETPKTDDGDATATAQRLT